MDNNVAMMSCECACPMVAAVAAAASKTLYVAMHIMQIYNLCVTVRARHMKTGQPLSSIYSRQYGDSYA